MSKHHYIPQFYLKGFTDPICPAEQEPYLWVHEKGERTLKKRAPKNIASEPHYYSAQTQNGLDTTPEVLLARIESDSAPLLKKLASGGDGLTEDERQIFALFLALMLLRVPQRRKSIENFATRLAETLIRERVSNDEVFESDMRNFEKETGHQINEPLDDIQKFMKNVKLSASPNVSLYHVIELLPELAPFLFNMQWLILVAKEGDNFITSDCPLVLVEPSNQDSFCVTGLAKQNVEVSFPLIRNACLLATWTGNEGYQDADGSIIEELNRRTVAFATQAVFSPENTARVQRLVSHYAYTYTEIL